MRHLYTSIIALFIFGSAAMAQIEIDGDMLDWAGIDPIDQGNADEIVGDQTTYPDFDLKDLYITHDTSYIYVRIDINDAGSFENFFNYTNPPVFEFYMDTEIGDTTGFDWGWWNLAMNYYVDLAAGLHPDSTERNGTLYKYNGSRIPTWAEGEFQPLSKIPMALNDDNNKLEFAIPRSLVAFGTEFRPWIYSVADWAWGVGEDQLPGAGDEYMLKYDFWDGGSVYRHNVAKVDQINAEIEIDGDMLDWAAISAADVDEIAEDTGDMPTGKEFDLNNIYITSDSSYLYMRIDIDPAGTFAGMYNNYDNIPAFQLFFETNWGDTSGLGYGGFWRLPVDYMIDLSAALHPDSLSNETPIYKYIADWNGAFEEFGELEGVVATFAKNDDDNALEIAIPRSAINVDTDVRPWVYVVGNEVWDNEEYFPNTIWEGWDESGDYYCLNYNFVDGASVKKMADNSVTAIGELPKVRLAKGFGLVANYPNPFNPQTTISFNLAKKEAVSIKVFDLLGRNVATLVNNQVMTAGPKRFKWNGKNDFGNAATSGVYFYTISTKEQSITRKMMLVK